MNAALRSALADANSDAERSALRAVQRTWLAYRNQQCGMLSLSIVGGQFGYHYQAICLFEKTRARIAELENPIPDRPR